MSKFCSDFKYKYKKIKCVKVYTLAMIWRVDKGRSVHLNCSSKILTALFPNSSAKVGPHIRAFCVKIRHCLRNCASVVVSSNRIQIALPLAPENSSGTTCTKWYKADIASNCNFFNCSLDQSFRNVPSSSGSK